MRSRALLLVFALLLSAAAEAQVMWQPTEPPLVTADNEAWYRAGSAIEWNGGFYLPAGAPEAFNRYQMVRAGSYRGIPLYTDTTLEPYSIVFVPIAGGRMQPYERPRTGMLAGSVGSRSPSFPVAVEPGNGLTMVGTSGFVAQAPAPPMFARAYDLAPPADAPAANPRVAATTGTVPESGSLPQVTATSGRTTAVSNRTGAAARPRGINNVWLEFDGRRWVSDGRAVDLTADFTQIGNYGGSPVYQRRGDTSTIYVPTTIGLAAPFKQR
jgi:hypothetical protein